MKSLFPMKSIKLLPLLAGAFSLSLSLAQIPAALAQSNMPPGPPAGGERNQMQRQNKLNLSPEQKEEMKRIKQATRQQMSNILTPEQKARLEAARANQENPRQVYQSLNFTEEQIAKMKEIRQSSWQQMEAILTPEQRQQMQQYQEQRGQNGPKGQRNKARN